MKKRVNITLSENALKCADIMAEKRGMTRSGYLNYLINIAIKTDSNVRSVLADEASSDMHEFFDSLNSYK